MERGRDDVVVASGGIAPYARDSSLVSMDARLVLRDDAIEISPEATACDLKRHRDRLLEADVIVTMTTEQKRMVTTFSESDGKDVLTLAEAAGETGDVEDPAGRDEDCYRACRDQIRRCLAKAIDRLAPPPRGVKASRSDGGQMRFDNPSDDEIREILTEPMTVAVVGCSPDSTRDSYKVARALQTMGHKVIPVNPQVSRIAGVRCYGSLRHIEEPVTMVDVFRRSEFAPGIVDDAIAIAARIVWLQLGVVHEEAAARAREAGLTVVMDRCPVVEYRRLVSVD